MPAKSTELEQIDDPEMMKSKVKLPPLMSTKVPEKINNKNGPRDQSTLGRLKLL
jgi:hypothetical protein